MSTTNTKSAATDPQELADREAVYRHAFEGAALDPEVRRRVRERAARITEEIRRAHGEIPEETLNQLLREVRDES